MTAAEFLERITGMRVLIVGDVCLDRWCYYDPKLAEPSAETGIPRIAVVRSELTPGAAGTVAQNLKGLGVGEVAVLGAVGEDGFGVELLRTMRDRGMSTDLVITQPGLTTFTYTKIINQETGEEDRPRVDYIQAGDVPVGLEAAVCKHLEEFASRFDVICVSDQAETERGGLVTAAVRDSLGKIAASGKLVWVDSRRRIELFPHAVLKANERESEEALERTGRSSIQELRAATDARSFFVTHGGAGVTIVTAGQEQHIQTKRVPNPVDICGAGDSFTSGAACALAAGASNGDAAIIGHLVASVTIMKKGTGFALPSELLAAEARLRA